MNRVLIITYGYDGLNSDNANAICSQEIIDNISKKSKVFIVTNTSKEQSFKLEEGNCTIHFVPIKIYHDGRLNFDDWRNNVIEAISNDMDINSISILLTISFPFNVQQIGCKVKVLYPHLNWFIYELDPFAYNRILKNNRMMFIPRIIQETSTFHKANKILLTHEESSDLL